MFQLQYPIIPLAVTLLEIICGSQSLIKSYVSNSLYFFLFDFDVFSMPDFALEADLDPSPLQVLAWGGWALFMAHRKLVLLKLLDILPMFLKVPLYKALFFLLLLPLPLLLALSMSDSVDGEEQGEDEEEEEQEEEEVEVEEQEEEEEEVEVDEQEPEHGPSDDWILKLFAIGLKKNRRMTRKKFLQKKRKGYLHRTMVSNEERGRIPYIKKKYLQRFVWVC